MFGQQSKPNQNSTANAGPSKPGSAQIEPEQHIKPRQVGDKELAHLSALLDIEAAARDAESLSDWQFVVANETRKLTRARQIFVFRGSKLLRLKAISGMARFESSSLMACDMVNVASHMVDGDLIENIVRIDLTSIENGQAEILAGYPFRELIWVPFISRKDKLLGAMILASDRPWQDNDQLILKRLAGTFGHALAALNSVSDSAGRLTEKLMPKKSTWLAAFMLFVAVMFVPVSMSTLAPFEVAPRSPVIVAAPLAGVIEEILVKPNAVVKKDDVIFVFANTVLKSKLDLAEKEIFVAAAELKKATQLAFDEARGQQDLRIAIANHSLKVSERNFAKKMLERATIRAEKSGVVLYSDRHRLIGQPVVQGERIMQIANPDQVELLIDVSVNDAILLNSKARVKIFLDSDPVHPREAVVDYIDYKAREHNGGSGQVLSFRIVASLKDLKARLPRLGVRGTAKIYGENVPLAFYLFRRPLAAVRQWVGL